MSAETIAVEMNDDEIFVANALGERRNALNFGDKNFPDAVGKRLVQHQAACLAEMAVAKHFGFYWTGCGKGSLGVADAGWTIEVRAVLAPHHQLIVRAADPERPHVLVYVTAPLCRLIGWTWPREARRETFFQPNSPQGDTSFWLVPQSELHSLSEIWRSFQNGGARQC